jgi:Gpi18-like mannosyltransferase
MSKTHNLRQLFFVCIALFLVWRIGLFALANLAENVLDYQPAFPYSEIMLEPSGLPKWLYSWANFDGVHYLTIADKGYVGSGLIQAFFPMFPILISIMTMTGINPISAGLLLSNLALIGSMISLYLLFSQRFSTRLAWGAVIALLLFPTSLYLGSLYNESLFLFFSLQALLWFEKRNWILMAVFLVLASSTRVVGILLVPAIFVQLALEAYPFRTRLSYESLMATAGSIKNGMASLAVGTLGLFSYMGYLWYEFGNPLYFYQVQSEFGSGRESNLILLPQVIWRYLKILGGSTSFDLRYYAYWQEFLVSMVVLVIIVWSWKKIPLSWSLFSLGAFLLPTLTGNLSSMPRYVLVCLPVYFLLGWLWSKRPSLAIAAYVLLAAGLMINTVLFIQGYWVA